MAERFRSVEDGYQADWSVGRTEVGGDAMFYTGPRPDDASVDGQGGIIRGNPVFTIDQAAYYLNRGIGPQEYEGNFYNSGAEWFGAQGTADNAWYSLALAGDRDGVLNTLTYGFFETKADLDPFYNSVGGNAVGVRRYDGFSTFDADQREATRQAIETWDDLIAVSFVETASAQADINLANTTTGPAQASAYLPYGYGAFFGRIAGDVAVNPNQASNHQFDEGQYGLTTLIHELGHSLGLEHPGDYNFGPGFDVTYDNGAEYYQDSAQYSIMSYWDAEETGANRVNWETLNYNYASTPSVHDVAAIQRIYGADMTTRTGNDTYGFNTRISTPGRGDDSFDFEKTPMPVVTIWDAGGIDTLDLSGYDTPSIIDLNPGQFSSAGGFYSEDIPTLQEINDRRAELGLAPRTQGTYDLYMELFGDSYTNGLLTDNIAIAYGVTIENAVGGGGNDLLIANGVANRLDGGAGYDIVSYSASDKGVKVNLQGSADNGYAKGDKLTSIEGIEGSNFADTLGGSNANDTLRGLGGDDLLEAGNGDDILDGGAGNDHLKGDNGKDVLLGGAGNDFLEAGNGVDVLNGGAGNDRLLGGNGADKFVFTDGGTDTIGDFNRGDVIDLTGLAGVDRSDITISRNKIFVENGDNDLIINIEGSSVRASDILVADPVVA